MEPSPATGDANATVRKRVSTACEACRVTKIKCQPSEQPGVCRKCLDSKKECISRTGPRTRRRRPKFAGDGEPLPQPPPTAGPSKTFTIDFNVPSQPDVDENFDVLRDSHAQFFSTIFPPETDAHEASPNSSPMTGFPTPPSSHTHSIQSLHAKPQFNLDSAESLLVSFRAMLPHFPCIVLQPDDTVSSLAATRPFVLLAILSAASGSRALQGHSLYDEEFRKVLGLKFVAGGERSIELLQGMLIYCAWYPFHLRPRNKQAFQYIRMAGGLIRDLELDQEVPEFCSVTTNQVSSEQLEKIRTYLAWYYNASNFMNSWRRMDVAAKFTVWTATCCDTLQRFAEVDGDFGLSYLARLASYSMAAQEAIHESTAPTEQQSQLILYGLEAQSREFSQSMLPHLARSVPVELGGLFFEMYLHGGCLLALGDPRRKSPGNIVPSTPKLRLCVGTIRKSLEFFTSVSQSTFSSFTNNDWTKFVFCIVLAVRLSFPMPEVPDWDDAWARSELQFDKFLTHMCDDVDLATVNTRVDALSAGRVVLRVVKDKYDRRVALHTRVAEATPGSIHGCPMFDHDMEQYIAAWDTDFDTSNVMPTAHIMQAQQPVFHDLWATMTMGWANEMPGEE